MTERLIDITLLDPNPEQLVAGYVEVAASPKFVEGLRVAGQLQPCLVTPTPDGRFRLVGGHRRTDGGKQLGWKTMRCYVKEYESITEELIDFYLLNDQREKSEAEKNREVSRLRELYGQQAEERRKKGVGTLAANAAKGKTSEQIAKTMGISKDEVERRVRVHDFDYRGRICRELLDNGLDAESNKELNRRWREISESQNAGVISLGAAADQVKRLQKEMQVRCSAGKKRIKDELSQKGSSANLHVKLKTDAHGFAPWGRVGDVFVGVVLGDEQHIYIREGKKGKPSQKVSVEELIDFAKCNVD